MRATQLKASLEMALAAAKLFEEEIASPEVSNGRSGAKEQYLEHIHFREATRVQAGTQLLDDGCLRDEEGNRHAKEF